MYTYSPSSMEEEEFDTCLGLGIGGGGGRSYGRRLPGHGERRPPVQLDVLFPPQIKEERGCDNHQAVNKKGGRGGRQKRNIGDDQPGGSHIGGGDSYGSTRKKLRLTKEQSTLLEESFRAHNILSHAQKHELARQLNLRPRQVEVWFQNRRARTKFKQTEVDCEFLRRWCERLTDENKRLKHELMELRRPAAATAGPKLYIQWPSVAAAATVSVCPSCEKVTVPGDGEMSKGSSYCS